MRLKSRILLIVLLPAFLSSNGQPYWQQKLRYDIDVTLDEQTHSLDGYLKLSYSNHSPDTLSFIWFHLWPNAYKNDRSAFSEQLIENGRTDFYFAEKEKRGYINQLDFRAGQVTCKVEDHPQFIDVIKLLLPKPLAPGDSILISTPFHVQLPLNFSRSGYKGSTYMVTQWYPKPAVYDQNGWHPMPYLDQGEFYSEFGDYHIQITLPANYVVAAPGNLLDSNEKNWLLNRTSQDIIVNQPKISTPKKGSPSTALPITPVQQTKTIQYFLENATDFAWFADSLFLVKHDTLKSDAGRVIELFSYYPPSEKGLWNKSIRMMKDALQFRIQQLGEYPYTNMSAVCVPMGFSGGMEYPAITSISGATDEKSLDLVLQHEIGHNWFQAALGSNERMHPWMDEGLNTFYDRRYEQQKYASAKKSPSIFSEEIVNALLLGTLIAQKKDQPIETPAAEFTPLNYQLIAYYKTARWLEEVEKAVGTPLFDSCMRVYYRTWKFMHPQPIDFIQIFSAASGLDPLHFQKGLEQIHAPSYFIPGTKKIRPLVGWRPSSRPDEIPLSILPVPGFNLYDGFMLGLSASNFNLPPTPFRFAVAPQFSTRSKKINGIGRVSYDHFAGSRPRRIQWSVNMLTYSDRAGTDSSGKKITGSFYKISPAVRFWFKETHPRSTTEKWLEWRSYLIGEQGFNYVKRSSDSLFYPTTSPTRQRYLHQLTYRMADYRVLYPYEYQVQWQQGRDFYRLNLSGQYFFNYAKGGGLSVRAFAATFGYVGRKDPLKIFNTFSFQPKLTAVRGNEDYTYGNVFWGRNETDGLAAQQIMMRDGDLKIRTDLFSGLQGRSDRWIASVNLHTTIPSSVLPPIIPLRLFLDAGTFAEAWDQKNEGPRFLYVGGMQLSLLKNSLNIYIPLLYSQVFSDNFRSVPGENKLSRKISFSIDIQRLNLRRLSNNQLPF